MKSNISIKDWQLAWIENAVVVKNKISIKTPKDISAGNYPTMKATVPGNFELDFMREGLLDDVYMGANSVKTQKLENLHLYYFTEFDYASKAGYDSVLCFEGVDTAAEIYLDGELLGFVENMLSANGKMVVCKFSEKKNGFYLLCWTSTGGNGANHFACTIGDGWTWEAYKTCMQKVGFYNEFEGF